MDDHRPPVLVYRETLSLPSEPFILAQGEALTRYRAHYFAIRAAAGHPLPTARSFVWRGGRVAPLRRYAWKRWGAAPLTARRLRALHPTVVHAHFGRDAVQLLPFVRRAHLPLVVTFHGHDATRTDDALRAGSYSDRLFLARRAELGRTAARTLGVSDHIVERLRVGGYPAERLQTHYIGVDVEAIRAAGVAIERDPDTVLFVGRLVEQKGAADLVDALAIVRRDHPAARLVVVGDGADRAALARQAQRVAVPVEFAGPLPQHEVWTWMARAAVVVVPSRTTADGRAEAFGLVAAEAQAAGAAVVATATGGLPEALAPDISATGLVPERDPAAMAAAILGLLSDPALRTRLAGAAHAWVAEHRELHRQTALLETIYDEVAA